MNKEKFSVYEKANTDKYGKAVVDCARLVMKYLDEYRKPLPSDFSNESAYGLMLKADKEIQYGLSGMQCSMIVTMVEECHPRGEEFSRTYSKARRNRKGI